MLLCLHLLPHLQNAHSMVLHLYLVELKPKLSLSGGPLGKFKPHYKDPHEAKPQLSVFLCEQAQPKGPGKKAGPRSCSREGLLSLSGQNRAWNTMGAWHTVLRK